MKSNKVWWLLALPLIVCSFTSSSGQSYRRDERNGVYFANFVKNPSVRLQGSVLATLMAADHSNCIFDCLVHLHCLSVNFAASLDGKPSCELLNTDKFLNADELIADERFDHYNIKTPCMSSPCKNGGTCRPIYTRNEYQCVCKPGFTGHHCEKEKWIQMNPSSVCFGAKDDTYGAFTIPTPGRIFTFKLKYLIGQVNCKVKEHNFSRWGCKSPLVSSHPMGTYITNSSKHPILPRDHLMTERQDCLKYYYNLSFANTDSEELLFHNLTTPLSVSFGQEYQVWFVEDLFNCLEADNGPNQTCAAVYGWYV